MQGSLVLPAEGWLLDSGDQNLPASWEETPLHTQLLTAIGGAEEKNFFLNFAFQTIYW